VSGYGDGGGKNDTPLAAATLLRSGYRPEPLVVPRKRGAAGCSSAARTGRAGDGGADRGSRRHADDRTDRATILESRSRASAPGRRNRWCCCCWWRSEARGKARRRRSMAGGWAKDGGGAGEASS